MAGEDLGLAIERRVVAVLADQHLGDEPRYVERHKRLAARRERLQLLAREWKDRGGAGRLLGLAGWLELFGFRGLAAPGSIEKRYLRWSTGSRSSVAARWLGVCPCRPGWRSCPA